MFGILAQVVGSLFASYRVSSKIIEQADEWFRLSLSIWGSGTITFLTVFGVAGGGVLASGSSPFVALAAGLFAACPAAAAVIYGLWRRSPLTKGIPILVPMRTAQDELGSNTVYLEPKEVDNAHR